MQIYLKQHYFMSLEEFARAILSMKPILNNPDAFDKWLKNQEIELKEPPTQKVTNSQSSRLYAKLITFYLMLYSFPPPGKVVTFL